MDNIVLFHSYWLWQNFGPTPQCIAALWRLAMSCWNVINRRFVPSTCLPFPNTLFGSLPDGYVRQIQRIHLECQVSDIHPLCQTICGEHTFEIPQQQLRYLLCLNNFGPVLNSIRLRGEQLGHVAVVDVVMGEVLHIVTQSSGVA